MQCSNCHLENGGDAQFCRACDRALPPAGTALAAPLETAAAAMPLPYPAKRALRAADTTPSQTWDDNERRGRIIFLAMLAVALVAAPAYWIASENLNSNTLRIGAAWNDPASTLADLPPPANFEEPPAPAAVIAAPAPTMPVAEPEAEQESEPPAPTNSRPAARKMPAAKKTPAKKADAPRPALHSGQTERRPPTPPKPLPHAPQAAAAAVTSWYAGLQAELQRCAKEGNFISRMICAEKAKFRFCGPGQHWGEVPECVQSRPRHNND